jgi:hypothetical protein
MTGHFYYSKATLSSNAGLRAHLHPQAATSLKNLSPCHLGENGVAKIYLPVILVKTALRDQAFQL